MDCDGVVNETTTGQTDLIELIYQTDILPGSNYFKIPTPAPIKKQYEQLYARVTERRPAFMNRATADIRLVAAHA